MTTPCATCPNPCRLTDGAEVYPHRHDLADKKIWVCDHCNARVGCHPGTDRALGTAADYETRNARMATHALLDPFWKNNKQIKRGDVYRYLAARLGIEQDDCHVGMFSAWQCYKANDILRATTVEQILEIER